MDKTALLIVDARQEYFAPLGKVVLPDGPKVTLLSMDVQGPDGAVIPHDLVHRTHLGSLNGVLAEVKRSDEVIGA
jgi:hypothetical protein